MDALVGMYESYLIDFDQTVTMEDDTLICSENAGDFLERNGGIMCDMEFVIPPNVNLTQIYSFAYVANTRIRAKLHRFYDTHDQVTKLGKAFRC